MQIALKTVPHLGKYAENTHIISINHIDTFNSNSCIEYVEYCETKRKELKPATQKAIQTIKDYISLLRKNHSLHIIAQDISIIKDALNKPTKDTFIMCDDKDNPVIYVQTNEHIIVLFNRVPDLDLYLGRFLHKHINKIWDLNNLEPTPILQEVPFSTYSVGTPAEARTLLTPKLKTLPDPQKMTELIKQYPYKVSYHLKYSHLLELYQYQSFTNNTNILYYSLQDCLIFVDTVSNKVVYILSKTQKTISDLNKLHTQIKYSIQKVTEVSTIDKGAYDFEYDKSILNISGSKYAKLRADYKKITEGTIPDFIINQYPSGSIIKDIFLSDMLTLKTEWRKDFKSRTKQGVDDSLFTINLIPYIKDQYLFNFIQLLTVATYKNKMVSYIISTLASSKDIYHAEHTSISAEHPNLTRLNKILIFKEYKYFNETLKDFNFRTGFSTGSLAEFKHSLKPVRTLKYEKLI